MNKWLIKIDRIAAWVLFVSMLLYFITGYGMTKGIINAHFATKFHLGVTPVIIIAFTLHTALAIRLAFIRWHIWGKGTLALLIAFYISFVGAFIYIDQWYIKEKQSEISQNSISSPNPTTSDNISQSAVPSTTSSQKTFTLSELSKYNGQNGNPAYVAVDGVVYDVSSVFTSGSHFSHLAGEELTDAFYTRHAKNSITKYPVVGRLE